MFSRRPLSKHSDSRSRGSHSRPGGRAAKPWVAPDCGQRATSHTDMPALDAYDKVVGCPGDHSAFHCVVATVAVLGFQGCLQEEGVQGQPHLCTRDGESSEGQQIANTERAKARGKTFLQNESPTWRTTSGGALDLTR